MMITIAILGLVGSISFAIFIQGFRLYRLNIAQLEVQRDTRNLVNIIEKSLMHGKAGTVTLSRNSVNDPYFSKVSFTRIDDSADVSVEIYQDGTNIYHTEGARTTKIGRNVRNLYFAPTEGGDNSIISVGICLEKPTFEEKTRTSKLSLQKVRLRNEED